MRGREAVIRDAGSFDRLTRLLAERLTNRAGFGTAPGALAAAGSGDARRQSGGKRGGGGNLWAEGPSGDGSRKANACTKDSRRCTGPRKTSRGKHNLNGKGRCRCRCRCQRRCQRRGRGRWCAPDRTGPERLRRLARPIIAGEVG